MDSALNFARLKELVTLGKSKNVQEVEECSKFKSNPLKEDIKQIVRDELNVWTETSQNDEKHRHLNRKFPSCNFLVHCGGTVFGKKPKLGRYRNFKPNFKRLHRRNNTQNVFNQGKIGGRLNWLAAPIVCGSEPVMGALENSTRNNHSSVGSSSDKCAFSNSGNSAENVTKKNVQEFSHVVSNPCEPIVTPKSKIFKPQVSVTCQRQKSQNVLNENILFEVIKCLLQAITRCEHVVSGSLPKESKIVQPLNVPVFSPN